MIMDVSWIYWDHFIINTNIESLCLTPETNIMSYASYTSVKILPVNVVYSGPKLK